MLECLEVLECLQLLEYLEVLEYLEDILEPRSRGVVLAIPLLTWRQVVAILKPALNSHLVFTL